MYSTSSDYVYIVHHQITLMPLLAHIIFIDWLEPS
jgi:hypothetical protein